MSPGERRGLGRGRWLAPWLALAACSTIDDTPEREECRSDAECAEGFVCAVDQGRCLPGNEAAPRAHLGFDIRERAAAVVLFRVEVDGCDCTVEEEANIRELALRRSHVIQTFDLAVTGETSLPEPPPDGLLPARFTVTQPSRYGLSPSPQSDEAFHPTFGLDDSVIPTELWWPRNHPLDVNTASQMVLWLIEPDDGIGLAPRYLGIVPPRTDASTSCEVDSDCCTPKGDCSPAPNFCDTEVGQCTAVGQPRWLYRYDYTEACSLRLEGRVILVDTNGQTFDSDGELAGASVRVGYADGLTERMGIPVVGEGPAADRPPQCDTDDDCDVPDQYCDEASRQCFVSLAGRPADNGVTTRDDGRFFTGVYTYCEGLRDEPIERRYHVTIDPPGPRPTVEYEVDATFDPDGGGTSPSWSGALLTPNLCVPNWGETEATIEVAVTGQPRTLVDGEAEYTCCDLGCLPSSATDAEGGPPPAPALCDVRTSTGITAAIRFEAPFVLPDTTSWTGLPDCIVPLRDADDRAGSLSSSATCGSTPGSACRVEGLALGTATEPRRYDVRVESPVGSVLASGDFSVELGAEPQAQILSLSPRVLVTGVVDVDEVICGRRPAGDDCAAREAVVLAERLRMPDEPPGSVPGPYFHEVTTFHDPVAKRDGAFVLPLDPGGVYVLTALPPAGAEGGPSSFTLVNLRADAPEPLQPVRLVLEDGVVVTLRLDQFDPRTTVAPLDRGSYLVPGRTLQLTPESAPIDLNEIGVCWTANDAPPGCQIRRMIPPGSDLARSQVGVVRFTARRSDQAVCPVRCPMAPPTE